MPFESKGWSECYGKKAQCLYENSQGHKFIVRQLDKYSWISINLTLPQYMCGQIIQNGQSDTYCFSKTLREISNN